MTGAMGNFTQTNAGVPSGRFRTFLENKAFTEKRMGKKWSPQEDARLFLIYRLAGVSRRNKTMPIVAAWMCRTESACYSRRSELMAAGYGSAVCKDPFNAFDRDKRFYRGARYESLRLKSGYAPVVATPPPPVLKGEATSYSNDECGRQRLATQGH